VERRVIVSDALRPRKWLPQYEKVDDMSIAETGWSQVSSAPSAVRDRMVRRGHPGSPQGTVTSLEAHRSARLDLQKDRTLRRRIDHPDGGMMRTLMRRSWIG
jgi:hypothetical protein